MSFIPHTEKDVQEMLATIGVANIEGLFKEIPANLKSAELQGIPTALNELELTRCMKKMAEKDNGLTCFIGAGSYQHYIPAVVWEVASRGEYLTAYTPYQAEASQGTLQVLYEYQTMMSSLMGLEVSNASLYDGASALAEAILMAMRVADSTQVKIILPRSIHPFYRQVAKTILCQYQSAIHEIDFSPETGRIRLETLEKLPTDIFPILVIPQPNFFGVLEEVDECVKWVRSRKGLAIGLVNPLAMALLKPPGEWDETGVDIACGEGQPLGIPVASGGPYYGFLCSKKSMVRQMPGRIVGRTVDQAGNPGFVLTLQAREQHIRRAKATSNICTNQGLLVTASTIYMSLMGPAGLRAVAMACHQQMDFLRERLIQLPGVELVFSSPFFHECVVRFAKSVDEIVQQLAKQKIQSGFSLQAFYPELGNCLLICVTEARTKEEIEEFVEQLKVVA